MAETRQPAVQMLDDLELLESAGQLPESARQTLADLRTLREGNALAPAQMPGAPAPTVTPAPMPEAPVTSTPTTTLGGEPGAPLVGAPGAALGAVVGQVAGAQRQPIVEAQQGLSPEDQASANAKGLLQVALYRGLRRPAAELNALAYKYGFPLASNPIDFKAKRIKAGAAGANLFREDVPHGVLDTLGAISAPLEVSMPALYGLGVLVQWGTEDERLADAVEGAGALVPGVLQARKVYKAVRGPTKNERLYAEAQREVTARESVLRNAEGRKLELQDDMTQAMVDADVARQQLRAQHEAAVQRATESAGRAEIAAANTTRAALARQDEALQALQNAEAAIPTREDAIREALGLVPGAPSPEVAGDMLRTVEATPLGAPRGVKGKMSALMTEATRRYEAARKIADEKGVRLPLESADYIALRDRAIEGLRRSIGKDGSRVERTLARRIQYLGVRGLHNPKTGEFIEVTSNDIDRLMQLRKAKPEFEPIFDPPTYREINELYAEAANAALDPRAYGVAADRAGREFYRLVRGQLKDTLGKMEQSIPALREAAADADVFYRRVVQPFRQTAKKVSTSGATELGAFRTTIGNRNDPTHLARLFTRMDESERMAHQMAAMDDLVRSHTDASGRVDLKGVLRDWNSAHPEWRALIASGGNARAKQVIDDWIGATGAIERAREAAKAVKEATQRDIKGAESTVKGAARTMRETVAAERAARAEELARFKELGKGAKVVLRSASDDVKDAIRALEESQKVAEQAGRRAVGSDPRVLSPGPNRNWALAAGHVASAGFGLSSQTPTGAAWAATQAGLVYALLHKPRLVAEAARMPASHPSAPVIAATLNALIRGYEAASEEPTTPLLAPNVPTVTQSPTPASATTVTPTSRGSSLSPEAPPAAQP